MGAGIWLALGVLAALRLCETTGVGVGSPVRFLFRAPGHPAFAPYGVFRASDG